MLKGKRSLINEIIFYMTKINEKKKKTKVCFFPNEK